MQIPDIISHHLIHSSYGRQRIPDIAKLMFNIEFLCLRCQLHLLSICDKLFPSFQNRTPRYVLIVTSDDSEIVLQLTLRNRRYIAIRPNQLLCYAACPVFLELKFPANGLLRMLNGGLNIPVVLFFLLFVINPDIDRTLSISERKRRSDNLTALLLRTPPTAAKPAYNLTVLLISMQSIQCKVISAEVVQCQINTRICAMQKGKPSRAP